MIFGSLRRFSSSPSSLIVAKGRFPREALSGSSASEEPCDEWGDAMIVAGACVAQREREGGDGNAGFADQIEGREGVE